MVKERNLERERKKKRRCDLKEEKVKLKEKGDSGIGAKRSLKVEVFVVPDSSSDVLDRSESDDIIDWDEAQPNDAIALQIDSENIYPLQIRICEEVVGPEVGSGMDHSVESHKNLYNYGELSFYLLPDLEHAKSVRGIPQNISFVYFTGVDTGVLDEGFLCYLAQLDYGLSLPLSSFAKGILNEIKACPAQLNGNMFEILKGAYVSTIFPRPLVFDLDFAGKVWNDNLIWAKGKYTGLSVPKFVKAKVLSPQPLTVVPGLVASSRRKVGKKDLGKSNILDSCIEDGEELESALKKRKLANLPPVSDKVSSKDGLVAKLHAVMAKVTKDLKFFETRFRNLVISPSSNLKSAVEGELRRVSHVQKGIVLGVEDGKDQMAIVADKKADLKAYFPKIVNKLEQESSANIDEVTTPRDNLARCLQEDGYYEVDIMAFAEGHLDDVVSQQMSTRRMLILFQ
ncbi:hypothetical protein GIB67_029643 [Kingdonia uniflora]|uniref:Uncharacterized protein n=1 Tax=Kingdonia uniflora TaxID=39325 RepID=A0A7J7LLV1_9MAGN|nr:hypothetical protein GIB67_029643 [Kingdonia uniflora]